MDITGAIFDFDGTLFDSMHVWKGVREQFFDRIGLKLSPEDEKLFKGMYLRESLILAKEKFDIRQSHTELYSEFFELIKEKYLVSAEPKNDIADFLGRLKARGVKMGIATASGEPAVEAALEKFGLREYFSSVYSVYTVDETKLQSSKVYDTVLGELGTEKETTWIFEDALYAVKTAKQNGYRVVGIYDKSEAATEEMKELCDIFIYNYSEIEL